MPGEINCLFTKGLIPFVEKEAGPEAVARLCRVAGRERDYLMIEDALRECGSKTRAAERLGLTRQSLQQMLRRRLES